MLKLTYAKKKGFDLSILEDPEIFVLDTGATCNSTGHSQGMTELQDAKGKKTKMGNGAKVATKSIGKLPFSTMQGTKGTMGGVHLIPGAPFNLVSGTKLLILGYRVTGDRDKLVYTKDGNELIFDIKVHTPEGMLLCARLKRTANEVGGAVTEESPVKTISIQKAHRELGHMGKEDTRKTAAALGWHVTRGKLDTCESCAIGKAKQKKVKTQAPKEKHKEINGRVYLDSTRIVNPKAENQPRRPNWTIMVDEKTNYKSSSFHATKDGMVEPICEKMKNWKEHGMEVQIL